MGKNMESRGRVVIPKETREELNLKPGQEIIIEKRSDGILIKPAIDVKRFSSELRDCVKESKIHPKDVKNIWRM